MFSFVLSWAIVASATSTYSADELCKLYEQSNPHSDQFAQDIRSACRDYSQSLLKNSARPATNFRPTFSSSLAKEKTCSIFRSGQPVPSDSQNFQNEFHSYQLGFSLDNLSQWKIDYVLDLRFDPHYRSFEKTFGKDVEPLPISSGENLYRYDDEKKFIEGMGAKSIYAPTLPEMEHFLGNFIPARAIEKNAKPYVCRLPSGIPDGEKLHWLYDAKKYLDELDKDEARKIFPMLVSANADCHDWFPKYRKARVAQWVAQVKHEAEIANQIFLQIANLISEVEQKHHRILYHCSSGTDRVGRISMILELQHYHVTLDELKKYRGPLSDSKIDLIALHYLLSQRAGARPEFRFLFPDLQHPENSWLALGLEPIDASMHIPVMDEARIQVDKSK